jgi:PAS domain S-box-containing protein
MVTIIYAVNARSLAVTLTETESMQWMFEAYFHSSPAPCAIVDRESRFLTSNAAWQLVLGYSEAELAGMLLVDLIHLDDLAIVYNLFRADAHASYQANRYRHRNGDWIWLVCSTAPLPGTEAFCVYMTDVTALMRTRQSLLQREELLGQMERLANVGAWEGTLESDRITWTDNMFHLYDLPFGPAPYHDLSLRGFDFDDSQRLSRAIGECRDHGTPWNLRLHMTTPAGKKKWVRSVGSLGLRDGKPYSIYGALQDISEQVLLEQELTRYAEALSGLQAIASNQSMNWRAKLEALLQLGCDELQLPMGVINEVSGGSCEIIAQFAEHKFIEKGDRIALEGTFTEAVMRHGGLVACHDVAHSELASLPSNHVLGFEAYVGIPIVIDAQVFGTLAFVSQSSPHAPFHERELHLVELIAQSASIEIARHNVESKLHKLKDDAESASRAKTRFLAQMSHELRTPLNSIIGYSARLLKKLAPTLESRYVEALDTIERNGEHLLSLINDLLDIASIDEGTMGLNRRNVQVADIVQQVLQEMMAEAAAKKLLMDFDNGAGTIAINADPLRVKQIVSNLVSNAIKYTTRGGVFVSLKVDADNDRLGITVRDTGIGISRSNQAKLFRRFERFHANEVNVIPGTGLGLALVWDLVAMHGGTTHVESEEGVGSCFVVKLPIHQTVT